jgi:hypothetical protein
MPRHPHVQWTRKDGQEVWFTSSLANQLRRGSREAQARAEAQRQKYDLAMAEKRSREGA